MKVDAFASMIIYTGATVAFFLLGAAVLHSQNLKVSNDEMVATLAHMYLESFGPLGWWIFVVGAFATLYSTAFAATASNARLIADAAPLFGFIKEAANDEAKVRRVKLFGVLLPVYGTVLYLLWPKPVSLILINGVGQALLLPFLAGAAIFLRYRKTETGLKPGTTWTLFLWLSALSLTAAGIWQLIERLR
jgi:Mn2+/Fe2+ NRAMP family transporter